MIEIQWLRRVCILLVIMMFSTNAQAQKEFGVINFEIYRDGVSIGKPQIIMELGSTAITTVAKPDGYSMKINLKKSDQIGSRIVDISIFVAENDKWNNVYSSKVVAQLRNKVSLNFKRALSGGESGKFANYEIRLTVDDKNVALSAQRAVKGKECSSDKLASWSKYMKRPVSWLIKAVSIPSASAQTSTPCCKVCKNFSCCGKYVCCADQELCPRTMCCNGEF